MRAMKRLYVWACKHWGPGHMTFSAHAWAVFKKTGNTFWRDRIDGLVLFFRGERDHCQSQWKREVDGLNP